MALGYPHPDLMLQQLTSRQISEMMAFAQIEPVGAPVPPDPDEVKKAEHKKQRANFEAGMRALQTTRT